MKALLGLTIILGGVLITQNTHAQQPSVYAGSNVKVSGPVFFDPKAHAENKPFDCPLNHKNAEKQGLSMTDSSGKIPTTGQ